jgi:hypothetical protein
MSKKTAVSVNKYLCHYAEHEVQLADLLFSERKTFASVLCVPVYKESTHCLDHFIALAIKNQALLIAVLNQPSNSNQPPISHQPCPQNIALANEIDRRYPASQHNQHLIHYHLSDHSSLLIINRYMAALTIPYRQGVGLARKIAADIALHLMTKNIIKSTWIHCSDADTTLPNDYFSATQAFNCSSHAALIYPHIHIDGQHSQQAVSAITKLYEKRLQHYVDGLTQAGSPYAYHTLGSTLCLSAVNYAQVRGFPKRAAGEDFYILNKLRKTGTISSLKKPIVKIQNRLSDRTPFGTGAAVEKLLLAENYAAEKIFYHPVLFDHLTIAISWINQISNDYFANKNMPNNAFSWKNNLRDFCGTKAPLLLQGFDNLKFDQCWQHCITQCKAPAEFNKQLHYWFDGFKTLKWLHALRKADKNLGNLNLSALEHSN